MVARFAKVDYSLSHMLYPPLPPAETAGPGKTLPDRVVEYFVARVFAGDLAPNERLPADRELAVLLGIDRTSLRMALQQLSRLGVLKIVHGSGVRVLDFREHAGLDFLALVFSLPGLSLGGSYLQQVLDDWINVMPAVLGRALVAMTHEDKRLLDAAMAEQLSVLDQRGAANATAVRLIDLEIALQDRVIRTLGNTCLILLGNSSRPLRRQLVTLFFETIDVRCHVTAQRALILELIAGQQLSAEAIAAAYRDYLLQNTQPLRERLLKMPMNPALLAPASPAVRSRAARAHTQKKPQA
jgi:DNA-binding FadR family transcriptional regulator